MDINILLQDHRLYHSELQQDYFITKRSGGTIYGQYKQALREVYKRFRGLKGLFHELELLKVDIDELKHKITFKDTDKFEHRRNEINLEKKQLDKIELQKNIEDTEREFKRFYQQAYSLKAVIGELTEERRNKLDKEMWIYKLKEMCAVDFISHGRLKNTTVELINSLDMPDRMDVLELAKSHDKLFGWYENKEERYELLEIDVDTVKLLGEV